MQASAASTGHVEIGTWYSHSTPHVPYVHKVTVHVRSEATQSGFGSGVIVPGAWQLQFSPRLHSTIVPVLYQPYFDYYLNDTGVTSWTLTQLIFRCSSQERVLVFRAANVNLIGGRGGRRMPSRLHQRMRRALISY